MQNRTLVIPKSGESHFERMSPSVRDCVAFAEAGRTLFANGSDMKSLRSAAAGRYAPVRRTAADRLWNRSHLRVLAGFALTPRANIT